MLKPSLSFKHMLAVTTAFSMAIPVLPAAAQDDTSTATPPARVGEIAAVTGSVNFNGAGSNGQWVAASANYPLTAGDSVFTQPDAQATLALDSSQLTLSGNTELQVTSLDNNTLAATASQGETFLAINYLQPGQSFAITTPRGTVTISQNGNYDIAAGDATDPTVVTVLSGAATVTDPGATLQVPAGQAAVLTGTDQTTAQLGDAQHDAFMDAMLAEQAPPPPSYAPPVVQQMTGVSELSNYGSWDQDPTYGAVWYPQVDSGWAPYHVGHWAYVAPWGYTWVDAAPWGFAPFHYGRWIDVNDRWGWAPAPAWSPGGGYGPDYQPVYAPALVSFFGVGVGVGLVAGALASGSIGWVPLGPNEPYYPPYHHSPQYLQRINYVNVRNINEVNIHNATINNYNTYVNRRAAVYVPAGAMSRGDMVSHYAHPVAESDFAKVRPVGFAAPNGGERQALPPPAMVHRAVEAPRLDTFAQRRSLPPAVISHEPAPAIHPGQAYAGPHPGMPGGMGETHPAMMQPAHPFSTMPGYHPPPPPPGEGTHFGQAAPEHFGGPSAPSEMHPPAPPMGGINHPETPSYHPPGEPQFHQNTPAFHPPAEPQFHQNEPAYHPPTEPQFHPSAPAYHPPPEPQFHPSAPAYHPPAEPQFHPSAPAYHPPAPQFHPSAPAYHPPAPHPEPPPPQHPDNKKPG